METTYEIAAGQKYVALERFNADYSTTAKRSCGSQTWT